MISFLTKSFPSAMTLGQGGDAGWGTAIFQTLFMTFWSAILGGTLGLVSGLLLALTKPRGILANKVIYWVVDKLVSIFRAVPFITLLAFVTPVTQKTVGIQIRMKAVLAPLTLGVFPFLARQVQVALENVDNGGIEVAEALGASTKDITSDIYLRESRFELARVSTVTSTSLISLTATAGAVGVDGLGNTAIPYGYNRFNNDATLVATLLVLLLVPIVQAVGDLATKKLNHQER